MISISSVIGSDSGAARGTGVEPEASSGALLWGIDGPAFASSFLDFLCCLWAITDEALGSSYL